MVVVVVVKVVLLLCVMSDSCPIQRINRAQTRHGAEVC